MSNQQFGDYRVTREKDMAAHDASPKWLRDITNYTVVKWGSPPLLRDVREMLPSLGATRVRGVILRVIGEAEPEHTFRTYGPLHPEADAHGKKLKPFPFAVGFPTKGKAN
jgi:hypothetical protein